MTISEKFQKYFDANAEDTEEETEVESLTITELTEMEIEEVVNELAVKHADTDEYKMTVENLKTLTEAYEKMTRAEAEMSKAKLEFIQSMSKKKVDWAAFAPKAFGTLVYGLVMVSFIAIEREHPPAMRIVQAANTLLNPKV